MRAYFLSSIFMLPAEMQLAGKSYPESARAVFDLFHQFYSGGRCLVPADWLQVELAKLSPEARERFKTRQPVERIVRYWAYVFRKEGILVVGDVTEEQVKAFEKLLEGE